MPEKYKSICFRYSAVKEQIWKEHKLFCWFVLSMWDLHAEINDFYARILQTLLWKNWYLFSYGILNKLWLSNDKKYLSCQLYQRSADTFLGVPFNIASYALFTAMLAQVCGYKPKEFVHTIGDAHIYKDHFDVVKEQISRTPYPKCQLILNPEVKSIFDFTIDDIKIENYQSHGRLVGKVSV